MNNAPKVKIEYLVDYALNVASADTQNSTKNQLSNLTNINNQEKQIRGKKGLILSGGTISSTTNEVSGSLLNGTYTFFSKENTDYNGFMGATLSRKDYTFINKNDYESRSAETLYSLLNSKATFNIVSVDENTKGTYYVLKNGAYLQVELPTDIKGNKTFDINETYYQIANEEFDYLASSTNSYFTIDNVYHFKWQPQYDKVYTIANVNSLTSGIYFVKTENLDAFGNNKYLYRNLPKDYNPSETYYTYSIVDNSHYVATLKEQAQFITIKTKNPSTYIKTIVLNFDSVSNEYATDISFSNAKSGLSDITSITSDISYPNNDLVFIHKFDESLKITQIQININKWSKQNSLMKILKITTGYAGIYNKRNLINLDFTSDKVSVSEELRFGITNNDCTIKVIDNDLTIKKLNEKRLIRKNVRVLITIDDIIEGTFYLDNKTNPLYSNEWTFDCVDKFRTLQNQLQPKLDLAQRDLYTIINFLLGDGANIVWEKETQEYCKNIVIEKSFFEANQTLYDLLLKCCQIGLLRIYVDRNDNYRITSGVN